MEREHSRRHHHPTVDTHLLRVVDRLGPARRNGTNNKTSRELLINALLDYGPDLAPRISCSCFRASPGRRSTACRSRPTAGHLTE